MKPLIALTAFAMALALPALAQDTNLKQVPPPYTPPTSGEAIYTAYCASCHGVKGLGDGPVVPHLKTPPPNLITLAQRNQGQFPQVAVSESIVGESLHRSHGTSGMPVWGPIFRSIDGRSEGATKIRVHNLIEYLKSLQVK
ncbi:MAG TPA: cytochrome c [Holophagaceae bacterium]|nr:cytochrome c [Holophagaceae bacterium]